MSWKSISKIMIYGENISQNRKEETKRIHGQSWQELCHTRKETNFLLTKGFSKISMADNTSSLVRISHLYGISY